MALPEWTRRKARQAIRQLDVKDPGFRGSAEVRSALGGDDVRLYLATWVFPGLRAIVAGTVKGDPNA